MRTWAEDHVKAGITVKIPGRRHGISLKGKMKGDYQKWLVQGICPKCARRDVEPERSGCAKCLGYSAKYGKKYYKEHRLKLQAYQRARYQAKQALKPPKAPKGQVPCPDEAPTVAEPTREWLEARIQALLHRA